MEAGLRTADIAMQELLNGLRSIRLAADSEVLPTVQSPSAASPRYELTAVASTRSMQGAPASPGQRSAAPERDSPVRFVRTGGMPEDSAPAFASVVGRARADSRGEVPPPMGRSGPISNGGMPVQFGDPRMVGLARSPPAEQRVPGGSSSLRPSPDPRPPFFAAPQSGRSSVFTDPMMGAPGSQRVPRALSPVPVGGSPVPAAALRATSPVTGAYPQQFAPPGFLPGRFGGTPGSPQLVSRPFPGGPGPYPGMMQPRR